MSDKTHYIYALTDPRTNEVRYVGCSVRPLNRYKSHLTSGCNEARIAWIRSLKDVGKSPGLILLDKVDGLAAARQRETEWIQTLIAEGKPLTNDIYKGCVGHNKGRR